MPTELALKAISYGLIWFSFLLLLVALLVSQRKEYNTDQVSRQIFPFTIAMIGLWALIALGIIYTQSNKARSLEQGSTLGESHARVASQAKPGSE
jgi:hypothetical protein